MYYYCCQTCGLSFNTPLPIEGEICQECFLQIPIKWSELDLDDTIYDCEYQNGETIRKPRQTLARRSFFLTFTKKPASKFEDVKAEFIRFTQQLKPKFRKIYYTQEHLDKSNPHIHAYVECLYSLPKSYMDRFTKHGQINKQKAKGTLENIKDYLSKENQIKILLDE